MIIYALDHKPELLVQGGFYELIRQAKDDAWESLQGDAAVAVGY